jgi:hypothetical protein
LTDSRDDSILWKKEFIMTVCGVICEKECKAFEKECKGCNELAGKVAWAPEIGKETCPIYTCVQGKGLTSCGSCDKRPCDIWLIETKNPSVSEEAFLNDINSRLRNLKK